jgi:type II secretory pathway pseudopilin PulG
MSFITPRVRRQRRKGFSLTETLVAVLITAITLIAFGTMFPSSSRLVQRSRCEDLATRACQSQLEFYREAGYASLPNIRAGTSEATVTFTPPSDLPLARGTIRFSNADSSFAASSATTGRVRIDATISWHTSGEVRRSVTETSIVLK